MPRRPRAPAPFRPVCPRCGYDLAGLWQARAAPGPTSGGPGAAIRGVCSECGLDFGWADVLNPDRHRLPWFFEHTPPRRLGYVRARKTLGATMRPRLFWSRVTLSTPIVRGRLLMWLVVLIAPWHLVWAAMSLARLVNAWLPYRTRGPFPLDQALSEVTHPLFRIDPSGSPPIILPDISYTFVLPLGAGLLMPLLLLILSRSRATSKIRAAHVLRAGVYGLGWIAWWYFFWALVAAQHAIGEIALGWKPGPRVRWGWGPRPLGVIGDLALAACLAWFARYWWCVITVGFRLARPRLVWALLMVAAILLGLNAALLDWDFENRLGLWLIEGR